MMFFPIHNINDLMINGLWVFEFEIIKLYWIGFNLGFSKLIGKLAIFDKFGHLCNFTKF